MKNVGITILFLFFSTPITSDFFPELIVWNVGQGQWVTISQAEHCYHFDVGGEQKFWRRVTPPCRNKKNSVFFTHFDWDHISALKHLSQMTHSLCVYRLPDQVVPSKRKRFLASIPSCEYAVPSWLKIYRPKVPLEKIRDFDENDRSYIFVLFNKILIPGDATTKAERLWAGDIVNPEQIRFLVLGHHGSRTSTSHHLLTTLSGLSWVVASARKKRYGHPHLQTQRRLKNFGESLITTELWGHLHWRLPIYGW